MTREEARKFLVNTKIYLGKNSKDVVNKLYSIISWATKDDNMEYPFLYINTIDDISYGSSLYLFNNSEYKELSANDILSIKIVEDGDYLYSSFTKSLYIYKHEGSYIENNKINFYISFDVENNVTTLNTKNHIIDSMFTMPFEIYITAFDKHLARYNKFWDSTSKTIRNIEDTDKYSTIEFKPFDKVLVREGETYQWTNDLYGCKSDDLSSKYQHICVGNSWSYCIPYEGNEHLLGTTNSPEIMYHDILLCD